MTNLLPYVENGIQILFQRRHLRKMATLRLKNEINYNLRIIDMINWKNIDKKTKNYLTVQLSTKSLEEYLYLGKPNRVDKILNAKPSIIADEDSVDKESLIGNIINKVKTIHIIANLPEELEDNNKSKFITRINNIHIGLNDLKNLI